MDKKMSSIITGYGHAFDLSGFYSALSMLRRRKTFSDDVKNLRNDAVSALKKSEEIVSRKQMNVR